MTLLIVTLIILALTFPATILLIVLHLKEDSTRMDTARKILLETIETIEESSSRRRPLVLSPDSWQMIEFQDPRSTTLEEEYFRRHPVARGISPRI